MQIIVIITYDVKGRLFIVLSTSTRNFLNTSSYNGLLLVTVFNARFVGLTIISQAPPIQELIGGINFHSMFRNTNSFAMKSCLTFCRACFSSFPMPTKFDPLSHQIISGSPLRAMNRRNVIKKLSVISPCCEVSKYNSISLYLFIV